MKKIIALATSLAAPVLALVKPAKESVIERFLKALAKDLTAKGFPATYDGSIGIVFVEGGKRDGAYVAKALKALGWQQVDAPNKYRYLYAKDKVFWPLEHEVTSGSLALVGESFFDNAKLIAILKKLGKAAGAKFSMVDDLSYFDNACETLDVYFNSRNELEAAKAMSKGIEQEFGVKMNYRVSGKSKHTFRGEKNGMAYGVYVFEGTEVVEVSIGNPADL